MAGNRKHGIGVMGVCGLVMILAGLVASVAWLAGRGSTGAPVGVTFLALGTVFLALGVANARRAAAADEAARTRPPTRGDGDRA